MIATLLFILLLSPLAVGFVLRPSSIISSSSSLHGSTPPPSNPLNDLTSNLLTAGPPQSLFVPFVVWFQRFTFGLMMNTLAPHDSSGRFVRDYSPDSTVTAPEGYALDGSEVLYVGEECPWCHRVKLALSATGVSMKIVILTSDAARATKGGWVLDGDPLDKDLYGVYQRLSDGSYNGRSTAPLLVNSEGLVSNESNDIMKVINRASRGVDLRPKGLEAEIDDKNQYYFDNLQNAVYKCGFATSQEAYDEAASSVSLGLSALDSALSDGRSFLLGPKLTECDLKIFPTLCRYDSAYSVLFRAPGKVGLHQNVDR